MRIGKRLFRSAPSAPAALGQSLAAQTTLLGDLVKAQGSSRLKDATVSTNRDLVLAAFENSYEPIVRYIALRIGNRDEAEDLASEVFVRALRKASSFKQGEKPIEAWLFKIAHNLLVDHLRRKSRNVPPVSLNAVADIAGDDDSVEHVFRLDDASTLNEALSVLTDSERQVIAMRFGGEMQPQEIATALGKSSGAVRWLQHSAVSKLRRELDRKEKSAATGDS